MFPNTPRLDALLKVLADRPEPPRSGDASGGRGTSSAAHPNTADAAGGAQGTSKTGTAAAQGAPTAPTQPPQPRASTILAGLLVDLKPVFSPTDSESDTRVSNPSNPSEGPLASSDRAGQQASMSSRAQALVRMANLPSSSQTPQAAHGGVTGTQVHISAAARHLAALDSLPVPVVPRRTMGAVLNAAMPLASLLATSATARPQTSPTPGTPGTQAAHGVASPFTHQQRADGDARGTGNPAAQAPLDSPHSLLTAGQGQTAAADRVTPEGKVHAGPLPAPLPGDGKGLGQGLAESSTAPRAADTLLPDALRANIGQHLAQGRDVHAARHDAWMLMAAAEPHSAAERAAARQPPSTWGCPPHCQRLEPHTCRLAECPHRLHEPGVAI